jgi:hypothetical protein
MTIVQSKFSMLEELGILEFVCFNNTNRVISEEASLESHWDKKHNLNSEAEISGYIALKLGNNRICQIHFYTLRHWKATMEYHRIKDILHVKQLLGHRKLDSTLIYTQLVDFEDDDYTCRIAKTISEATPLIEAGFEYVPEIDGCKLFRKRK